MLFGILILVYLGRDTARLMNARLDDIDLKALVSAESVPSMESLQGKIVVMHFWGTWCGPCREEFPRFIDVYRRYENNPQVEIISISCSAGTENDLEKLKSETASFLQSFDINMPTYSDPAMFTRGKIARMLASGGFGYPFTLVADRQGIVREYWMGSSLGSMTKLKTAIDGLLNQP